MKNLVKVQSALYCEPWHILAGAHQELCDVYQKYLRGDLEGREAVERPSAARGAGGQVELTPECVADSEYVSSGISWAWDTRMGVAIVWLEGIIAKRAPDSASGPAVVDLAKLDVVLDRLTHEEELVDISTVVLVWDTPGGSGVGLPETAERIQELSESGRLVVSYTDYQCCSAGYWLAAAADAFYAAGSAIIGSIGTYIAALDSSRHFEMEGLKLKLFRHGELKGLGLPGKRWTKGEEQFMTDMVAEHGEQFREWVRSRRPGVGDELLQGQWFTASAAEAAVLHDGLYRDLGDLLAALVE